MEKCNVCINKKAEMVCGNCKNAYYCSDKCLNYHWKNGHKENCQKIGFTILEGQMLSRVEQLTYKGTQYFKSDMPDLDEFGLTHQFITSNVLNYMDDQFFKTLDTKDWKNILNQLFDSMHRMLSITKEQGLSDARIASLAKKKVSEVLDKKEQKRFFELLADIISDYLYAEIQPVKRGINEERLLIGLISNDMALGANYVIIDGEGTITYDVVDGKLPAEDNMLVNIKRKDIKDLYISENVGNYLRKMRDSCRVYPRDYIKLGLVYAPKTIAQSVMSGTAVYAQTHEDKFQIIHSMAPEEPSKFLIKRPEVDIGNEESQQNDEEKLTLERYINIILEKIEYWFIRSFDHPDVFWLGRILHLVQDSYSPSHVHRDDKSHRIISILTYSYQESLEHVKKDNMNNYLSDEYSPSKKESLKQACIAVLTYYFRAWIDIMISYHKYKRRIYGIKEGSDGYSVFVRDLKNAHIQRKQDIIRTYTEKLTFTYRKYYFRIENGVNPKKEVGGCDVYTFKDLCRPR